MIYDLNLIKKESNIPLMTDGNFMSTSIELLEESDNEIRNIMLSSYGVVSVTESFEIKKTLRKFGDLVSKIIQKFIKTIKFLIGKVNMFFMELFADKNKMIIKYKNKLLNMPADFELSKYTDIQYYNYTYLDADIPDPNLYLQFSENYELLLEELKKISNSVSKEEIIDAINRLESSIYIGKNSRFLMSVRSDIINTNDTNSNDIVTAETYQERLFALFRNGSTSYYQGKLTIPPYQVKKSCERCLNYKDMVNKIDKQRSAIEEAAKDVERKINKLTSKTVFAKDDFDIEIALDRLCKKKIIELTELCNVIVMAFTAKMEACKECSVMDKKICFKAISHIVTTDLEEV